MTAVNYKGKARLTEPTIKVGGGYGTAVDQNLTSWLLRFLQDIGSYLLVAQVSITSWLPKHLHWLGPLIDDPWRAFKFSICFGQITCNDVEANRFLNWWRKLVSTNIDVTALLWINTGGAEEPSPMSCWRRSNQSCKNFTPSASVRFLVWWW